MSLLTLLSDGNFSAGVNDYILRLIIIVLAISVHEFAHAFTAYKLGDFSQKGEGRLTLNPVAHLDLWGFLMIATVGIGWGRPVEVNPNHFKNPRKHFSLVAAAGPISNILISILIIIILAILNLDQTSGLAYVLVNVMYINLVLAFFNLIPLYPLDGFNLLSGILPLHLAYQFEETRRYGIFVLIALMLTGGISKIIGSAVLGFLKLISFLF